MTFLDRSIWHCCGYKSSTTIGDAFERFVLAAWSTIYLMACLDYLMVPLLGGNLPRWWGAALVAATGTSVIGLSSSIYGFPRGTSSLTAEEGRDGDGDETIGRTKTRRGRRAVAVEMAFILCHCEKIKSEGEGSGRGQAADAEKKGDEVSVFSGPDLCEDSDSDEEYSMYDYSDDFSNPSSTALPNRHSFKSAYGATLANVSSRKPLQQIGSVEHEEMRLGVRSGQVHPPMTLPKISHKNEHRW